MLFALLVCVCRLSQAVDETFVTSASDNGSLYQVNEVSSVLNTMLKNYDRRIRPDIGGPPLKVSVTMHILATVPIDEINMDFTATFFFRQYWTDRRLAFAKYTKVPSFKPTGHIVDQIWLPDTFFENDMTDHKNRHDFLLEMTSQGYITYSSRKRVRSYCPMDLRRFPMDEQSCELAFESYAYSDNDVAYSWREDLGDPVTLSKRLTIPHYSLIEWEVLSRNNSYITGNFSALQIKFRLRRHIGFYLIQDFIPTALIVMLSWVGFWINEGSIPARVSLGITTVLAITTLLFGVQNSLPKVGYIKAIDFYLLGSFFFVFGALVEYAVICTTRNLGQETSNPASNKNTIARKKTAVVPFTIRTDFFGSLKSTDDESEMSWEDRNESHHAQSGGRSRDEATVNMTSQRNDDKSKFMRGSCHPIDKASRILFPAAFVLFIVTYCIVFVIM